MPKNRRACALPLPSIRTSAQRLSSAELQLDDAHNGLVSLAAIALSSCHMTRRRKRAVAASTDQRWYQSNVALSLSSGLLLWAAFPPVGFSLLAWIAPIGWLQLIRRPHLVGRAPYPAIWLGGAVHWLAMLVGITFAHPLNLFGWLTLCCYLAFYLPLFVGLTRVAVHVLRVPLMLAAPVVWTGFELLRGHLFTGFSLGLLGHSQFEWTLLIQLSDVWGAYGVSFLMMFVAASLACCCRSHRTSRGDRKSPSSCESGHQNSSQRRPPETLRATVGTAVAPSRLDGLASSLRKRLLPILCAATAIAAALGYGSYAGGRSSTKGVLKVALIQESFNTRFEANADHNSEVFRTYGDSTLGARDAHPDLDLIVWPESVFTANSPEFIVDDSQPGDDAHESNRPAEYAAMFRTKVENAAQGINRVWTKTGPQTLDISLLVGTETYIVNRNPRQQNASIRIHNTALLIRPCGGISQRYYKMHPVMFGEYIPWASVFPWIYQLTPLPRGLTRGDRPKCFELNGVRMSPSICFESTVPHLIRRQVARLKREGTPPDVLVNITHDGWFWGSSILDLQLACAVFRSVELRRPFLVAANAGISAWIDEDGRIVQRGPRQGRAVIIATVGTTNRSSWYAEYGDIPAGICLLACVGLILVVWSRSIKDRNRP